MPRSIKNKAAQYIERYRAIYGDKYQYPEHIKNSTEVIDIQCPVHGTFQREAYRHLTQGCPKCAPRGDPFKTFTDRARALFGEKFIYDRSTFKTAVEKMRIVCPDHGEFWQAMYSHVRLKHGCPKCGFEVSAEHSRDDLASFLEKAKAKHGDTYDYAKVNYTDSTTPVEIYCKTHSAYFKQQPASHIRGGGCRECGFERTAESRRQSDDEINKRIGEVVAGKYTFEKVVDYANTEKVKMVCPVHGEFLKNIKEVIYFGSGCAKCSGNHQHTTQEFIELARQTHGDKYDYSKTVYTKSTEKVTIICPKHGEFEQKPLGHVRTGYGCYLCNLSEGELFIIAFLKRHKIDYKRELVIPPNRYRYDFYLPDYHIFIEFHGKQHYQHIKFFHKTFKEFKSRQLADVLKAEIVKGLKGKLIVPNYKHAKDGTLEAYLTEQLLKHGVPPEVFSTIHTPST